MQRFLIIMGLAITLFSCTSIQVKNDIKNHITNNNWFAIGEYDASNGYIEKSKKALTKMSLDVLDAKVNYSAYLAGYEQSLVIYCEPANAYILGVKGLPYHNVCDRYARGWAFYQDWLSGRKSQAGSMF